MAINNRLNKNYIFFFITIIFLSFISINNTKNFHILTYSVPAYNFKDSSSKSFAYGLGAMSFKYLALNIFNDNHGISRENSIRHIHYTSNYQISWLLSKEKFFMVKKEFTPEKLLDISKKIYTSGDIKKNYVKFLNFLFEFNSTTKFEIKYDEKTKDFYISNNNIKISYIMKHVEKFNQSKELTNFLNILEFDKDKIKKFIKIKSINKEIIKKQLINNYYGSYNLDFKNKNFSKSLPSDEEIEFSNINFISRDIYKISKRYIENNTYFYSTPKLKEEDIIIADYNEIQNLKITDCENFSYENGFKLDCKYFPFKISKDVLNFNFF
jgi:hypothetical protein